MNSLSRKLMAHTHTHVHIELVESACPLGIALVSWLSCCNDIAFVPDVNTGRREWGKGVQDLLYISFQFPVNLFSFQNWKFRKRGKPKKTHHKFLLCSFNLFELGEVTNIFK